MKRKRTAVILILLALLCAALLATGTYAAYTSVKYVKRVITSKSSDDLLCFSSNYLEETSQSSQQYEIKTISAGDNVFIIYLDIYNFSLKGNNRFSAEDIKYILEISLINGDTTYGGSITELLQLEEYNFTDNKPVLGEHTITGGSANTHTYKISSIEGQIETLRQYKIRIKAIPQNLLGNKMLAADLVLVASAQSTPWDGKRIESDGSTYDAFNYELTGTSQEQRVLTWKPDEVALSPFSLKDLPTIPEDADIAEVNRSGSVTLDLGADGTTSYRIQFYKVNGFKGTPDIVLK